MPLQGETVIGNSDVSRITMSRNLEDAVMILFHTGHDQVWQRVVVQQNRCHETFSRGRRWISLPRLSTSTWAVLEVLELEE